MKYELNVTEFPDDTKSADFKCYKETVEIPDEDVREELICTFCGFPAYPECKKDCHNFKYDK